MTPNDMQFPIYIAVTLDYIIIAIIIFCSFQINTSKLGFQLQPDFTT